MSQVNLLPPEIRERQVTRRRAVIVGGVGAVVLALIGAFSFAQEMQLSSVRDELSAQEATNAQLAAQIAELQPFAELQAALEARQQLLQTLYRNEVSWASVLLDVSRVIPEQSYLTQFSGQITAPTVGVPGEPGGEEAGLIGNVTFSGVARETETIASWLTRLEQVRGWVNAWVDSAAEQAPFSRIYTFDGGLDLTLEAATPRGRGEEVAP
jgi:Tfp pilus assembly protein PilN